MEHSRVQRRGRCRAIDSLLMSFTLSLAGLGTFGCSEPPPPAPGHIVYVSGDGANATTWALDLTGGAPQRLAASPAGAMPGPAAAPPAEGWFAQIVVENGPDGHRESLQIVDARNDRALPLGVSAEFVRNPVWLPRGDGLIVESSANSFRDLYSVRLPSPLPAAAFPAPVALRLTDAQHGSFDPAISPDSTRLAFGSSRDGNAEVYVQPLAGGAALRLTDNPADDRSPAWRPDGARIAWIATRDGHPRVWTMSAEGGDAAPLRRGTTDDLHFAWSPDGRFIAVATLKPPDEVDLYVYDAARGVEIGAFADPGAEEHPAWSPTSDRLVFAASREGNVDLYVGGADGRNVRRLTTSPLPDWLPRWVW